jgi:hypothetical protein
MRFILPVLFMALTLAIAGCVDTPQVPVISSPQYSRLSFIAPPPPIEEDVPESPNPRQEIWRPGYWAYDGSNFSWVSGEMMPRPAPWAVWSPDQWVRHTYGWGFEPGTWQ